MDNLDSPWPGELRRDLLTSLPRANQASPSVSSLLGLAVRIDNSVPVGVVRFITEYGVTDFTLPGYGQAHHDELEPTRVPESTREGPVPGVHNVDSPQGYMLRWGCGRKVRHIWQVFETVDGWAEWAVALCGLRWQEIGDPTGDPPHCKNCVRAHRKQGQPEVQGVFTQTFLTEGGDPDGGEA